VRLIAAQFVRPFVKTNKTDAADAEGIEEAAQSRKIEARPCRERQNLGALRPRTDRKFALLNDGMVIAN
jgi:transposase